MLERLRLWLAWRIVPRSYLIMSDFGTAVISEALGAVVSPEQMGLLLVTNFN